MKRKRKCLSDNDDNIYDAKTPHGQDKSNSKNSGKRQKCFGSDNDDDIYDANHEAREFLDPDPIPTRNDDGTVAWQNE